MFCGQMLILIVIFCRFHQEGYEAGLTIGKQTGSQEGWKLGWQKGSAIGSEVLLHDSNCKVVLINCMFNVTSTCVKFLWNWCCETTNKSLDYQMKLKCLLLVTKHWLLFIQHKVRAVIYSSVEMLSGEQFNFELY